MMIKLLSFTLGVVTMACATMLLPPRLQDRTLLIDLEGPNLIYPYTAEVCKNPDRRFFKNCHKERQIDVYNMNDFETRRILHSAGFECTSKQRFQY